MSQVLTREPLLQALSVTSTNQDQRVFLGNAAFAGGGRTNAHPGKYMPLDLPTLKAVYELSADGAVPTRIAAAAVRDHDSLLRALIEDVEDEGLAQLPADKQTFFVIGITDKGATLVEGGLRDAALARLLGKADLLTVRALSIQRLLREVRENAAKAGLKLPARFTLPRSSPGYATWVESIAERRRRADQRWEAIKDRKDKR